MLDLRVPRRRFMLLLLLAIACLVACRAHIRSVGHSYAYRLDEFAGCEIGVGDVLVSPQDMLEVRAVSYDGDVPVLELEAKSVANGTIMVSAPDTGMMFWARVARGLVIVADGVNFTGWEWVGWSIALCFCAAGAICLANVFWLYQRSWYDYEMAAYLGAGVFCVVQTIVFAQVMFSGDAQQFLDLALLITSIADRFVWLSLAPMALAAVLVSLSNVALVRHEGKSLTNLLGVAAGLAYACACLAWRAWAVVSIDMSADYVVTVGINSLVPSTITFGVALLVGASASAWLAAHHLPSFPRDYLIILGCGLRADGSPTPLLAGRVDAARAYAHGQEEAGEGSPRFVPSGGKGSDERWAEAESMRRYLVASGVEDGSILPEERSTNTRENFAFSAEVIARHWASAHAEHDAEPRVAFATTNYHVFRSYTYAHDAGLAAEGIAAPTKLYFWPNAFLREFVGLLAAHAVQLGVAYLLVLGVYAAAEWAILLA